MLKVTSVYELPFIKGMKDSAKKIRRVDDVKLSNAILEDSVREVQKYIGTSTDQNDTFRITVEVINNEINFTSAKLEFLNYLEYIPAQYFIPSSGDEMYREGESDLAESVSSFKANRSLELKNPSKRATISYDRIVARDYANKYTSEQGNGYDTDYWNSDYKWHTEDGGVDCANYVS